MNSLIWVAAAFGIENSAVIWQDDLEAQREALERLAEENNAASFILWGCPVWYCSYSGSHSGVFLFFCRDLTNIKNEGCGILHDSA